MASLLPELTAFFFYLNHTQAKAKSGMEQDGHDSAPDRIGRWLLLEKPL